MRFEKSNFSKTGDDIKNINNNQNMLGLSYPAEIECSKKKTDPMNWQTNTSY